MEAENGFNFLPVFLWLMCAFQLQNQTGTQLAWSLEKCSSQVSSPNGAQKSIEQQV